MNSSSSLDIDKMRDVVLSSYKASEARNRYDNPNSCYIYPNQKEDANNIVDLFYRDGCHVVSVSKKTKIGANGLMIELAKLLTTHPDPGFIVPFENIRIITGMSNKSWQDDFKKEVPDCFRGKVYHHGQLEKSKLVGLENTLIIIDEIDSGNKLQQRLDTLLKDAGLLDVNYMKNKKVFFVFISATNIRELHELYKWGRLHKTYRMTIPGEYIGHKDFLEMDIIKEFYALNSLEEAERWIDEDIIPYETDYRVHILRIKDKNTKYIQKACEKKGIEFRINNSDDRLTPEDEDILFKKPLTGHCVIVIKGFLRRANILPNEWKIRIGAVHEEYTKKIDYNVQVQGLPGRMTGYWRTIINSGHKTGPYRTSIKAIKDYEKNYDNPFGDTDYKTSGFSKKQGKIKSKENTFVTSNNINNLDAITTLPQQLCLTVPIVLKVSGADYKTITKSGKLWDFSKVYKVIEKYKPEIIPEIERIEKAGGKDQIVSPQGKKTYEAYITNFVNAFNENRPHRHVGNIKEKEKDIFQIYLDNKEYRVIVSFYYGSRIQRIN